MVSMENNFKTMAMAAGASVVLAISSVLGMIVLAKFQETANSTLAIVNTTILAFITGLGIFGTFMGIIVLGIVAKVVLGIFKS
jgi:thiamine transporter ThiT